MSLKSIESSKNTETRNKNESSLETNNPKIGENEIIRMIYKLEFDYNSTLRLFGKDFVNINKDKGLMIIAGKEYEIKAKINLKEFKEYGINEEDERLEVMFKGKGIKDMSYMFSFCEGLIQVDFSSFHSENVTNMQYMFNDCFSLIRLYFSSFNTQKVTDMNRMFSDCKNLIKLDLSSFNTENVTNMHEMFNHCFSLVKLDLSSFNTENVTNMSEMFNFCESLTKIDLSSFNTKKVTYMSSMFNKCKSLIKIKRNNYNKAKFDRELDESELAIIEV